MMPPWTHESPRNKPRAGAIAATLLEHDFDILCLQKVFDSSARAMLESALSARYPWRYGPANNGCSLRLNSGVWVLSRHPLAEYREIQFEACGGIECASRKGALIVSGTCGSRPFRLVATHLQGEEGARFTPEHQRIRDRQMAQIRDQLLLPNLKPAVPFFFCGDFGTPRFAEDGHTETDCYRRMLSIFGAENGAEPRFTLDDTTKDNSLALDRTGRHNELDYVLVRANGCDLQTERKCHAFQRDTWDDSAARRSDLSYRYAVSATVTFRVAEQ